MSPEEQGTEETNVAEADNGSLRMLTRSREDAKMEE